MATASPAVAAVPMEVEGQEHETILKKNGEADNECDADARRMKELQGQVIEALMRIKAGGTAGTIGGHPDGPAHMWHSKRRAALMKVPGVKALLHDCGVGSKRELSISVAVTISIICVHFFIGCYLTRFTAESSWSTTALGVLLASATVGAQFAYLLQALNHELGHGSTQVDLNKNGRQTVFLACYGIGSLGAALCHIPWAVYYMGGGHFRHHRFVGSARDVDEEALFVLYQPRFPGVAKRLCWLSVAAVAVPIWMFVSLIRCAMFDWRSNTKELSLFSLDLALKCTAYYSVGSTGAVYLYLSSLFSMGFLCHPLAAFWILQHLCVGGAQPTTSYKGSALWNTLCLNELLHVEHHDLAGVAWRHLPRLRELAPELYEPLYAETSVFSLIWAWGTAGSPGGDKRFEWDFACRTHWGYTRRDAQMAAAATASVMKQLNGNGANGFPSPARAPGARLRRPAASNPEVITPPQTPPLNPRLQAGVSSRAHVGQTRIPPVGGGDRPLAESDDEEM